MEKIVEQTYLYDFYGELLNPHQQRIYEEVVLNDYSISEVARDEGISRQGVYDMIKRCTQALSDYESRLHLVERFMKVRDQVNEIRRLTDKPGGEPGAGDIGDRLSRISELASRIIEEL